MSFKTILWAGVFAFLALAVYKVFKVDTTDPQAVISRYLSHWESNNTTGMYPLLSERAKNELRKANVQSVTDYYAWFTDHRADLSGYQLVTHEINENNGRFWVHMRVLDYVGREVQQDATFVVVREVDGWRVDGWQSGGSYNLP